MDNADDGKIRISCSECGKRVKFSADKAGATFRCPRCHTTIVTPVGPGEPAQTTAPAAVTKPEPKPASRLFKAPGAAPPPAVFDPQPKEPAEMPPAIDRLNTFLVEEQRRIGNIAAHVVKNSALSEDQQKAELLALRHEKAVEIRSFAGALLKEVDESLAKMHTDPAAETDSGKARIANAQRERVGLIQYMKLTFQMRTVQEDDHQNAAMPDTP
jgi:ribosomal protein S27E